MAARPDRPAVNETLDALELELRRLQGVVAVGFDASPAGLNVRVCLAGPVDGDDVLQRASLLAQAHDERAQIVLVRIEALERSYSSSHHEEGAR